MGGGGCGTLCRSHSGEKASACQNRCMATLLPVDFDLTRLEHSERRVCAAFVQGLDDSWLVIPHVPVTAKGEDGEIDVVLVSAASGVVLVEVKGGRIDIQQGEWLQNGKRLPKSPVSQVSTAKHLLVKRMRTARIDITDLFMRHVIALPDAGQIPAAGLTPDAPRDIVLGANDLEYPEQALHRLFRDHSPVPVDRLEKFVQALRPDIHLADGQGDVLRWARNRLDEEAAVHLASVKQLDVNQRVLVTGGAGTGKTMVVAAWARQAVARGERVLVACFNKPMAEQLQRVLRHVRDDCDVATGVSPFMVGTYHDLAVRLLEPHGFRIGQNPNPDYWRHVPTEALAFHAAAVGTPFDTIVVDEGQDIHPDWLRSLERLLDPAGPRRVLMTADPMQAIYVKPWEAPPAMTQVPLVYNLRNCRAIANYVATLGGPTPLPGAPFGREVEMMAVGGRRELRKRVRDAVTRLTTDYHVPFGQIAVLTTTSDARSALLGEAIEGVPLVRWEERSEEAVLCETVHRTKGIERTAIVLVDLMPEPDPTLRYVGASRAISSLHLIHPTSIGSSRSPEYHEEPKPLS